MSNDQQEKVANTASDYQDFSFEDLQLLADYITKQSIPVNMTLQEMQAVLTVYTDFIQLSFENLNLLRRLAGDPDLPIPGQVRAVEGDQSNG